MKKLFVRASLLSATIAAALATVAPAFAQEGTEPSGGTDISTTVIWSLIGVGIFSLAMGILYLLKRQVGGFPENPSWVAPISIQRASELPSEPDAHGHDDHGHAPAH
jgi:tellurite resistance protein TehA-like permease